MSIIDKSRLSEFSTQLWNKVKGLVSPLLNNLAYNNTSKVLTATKKDGTAINVDLNGLATNWNNLDSANESLFKNLLYGLTKESGYYNDNGSFTPSGSYYKSYKILCTPGKTYRRMNKNNFQNRTCNLRGGTDGADFIQNIQWVKATGTINGREYWEITIPNNTNITHFTLSYNNNIGQGEEIMVWEASIDPPFIYVENMYNSILLEKNIQMEFDPTGTNLNSITIAGVIRELDANTAQSGKVQSINNKQPDAQGNIQLVAGDVDAYTKSESDIELAKYVPLTDVNNTANKIPRLDDSGKLVNSTLNFATAQDFDNIINSLN